MNVHPLRKALLASPRSPRKPAAATAPRLQPPRKGSLDSRNLNSGGGFTQARQRKHAPGFSWVRPAPLTAISEIPHSLDVFDTFTS